MDGISKVSPEILRQLPCFPPPGGTASCLGMRYAFSASRERAAVSNSESFAGMLLFHLAPPRTTRDSGPRDAREFFAQIRFGGGIERNDPAASNDFPIGMFIPVTQSRTTDSNRTAFCSDRSAVLPCGQAVIASAGAVPASTDMSSTYRSLFLQPTKQRVERGDVNEVARRIGSIILEMSYPWRGWSLRATTSLELTLALLPLLIRLILPFPFISFVRNMTAFRENC